MAKHALKKKRKRKTALFSRITVRLIFPLLFLAAVFTAMQLTNQMNAMNQSYTIESRFAFESIQKTLIADLKNREIWTNPITLSAKLQNLADSNRVSELQLFNLFDRAPLFPDEKGDWTHSDYKAIEESLRQKQLGKPYYVRVNKESKLLIAYIPLESVADNQIWIARAVFPLAHVKDALNSSRWTLGLMFFLISMTGVIIGRGLAKSIVNPIRSLNQATQDIVEGHLGMHVKIATGDEIETLADTFNHMSESLKAMKHRAEDSNPLTQLPGNQGIFYEINRRSQEKQKFVVFHTDLDRFKVFNDTFGLARGDDAIKKTAAILREIIAEKGSKDDFVGHQGGDDFVLIVKPSHAKEIAEMVIDRFDHEVVKSLYRKEDYDRGFTLHEDRRKMQETGGTEAPMIKFPLIAISLAGVSNAKRDFADYFDCLSRAVPIKKKVKKEIKSCYFIQE